MHWQLSIKALLSAREANDKLNILRILVFATKFSFYKTVLSILTLNKFYFKLQVTNFKKKEITANAKPQTLEKHYMAFAKKQNDEN